MPLRYLDSLLTKYWKRFSTDYLGELREQHMYSSKKAGKSVLVNGDVVLIKDDDLLPRGRWKKGVVTRLIRGKDDQVRGAVIRCIVNDKQVEYERPVQRLVPFELIPERSCDTIDLHDSNESTLPVSTSEADESIESTLPVSTSEADESIESTLPVSTSEADEVIESSVTRPRRRAAIKGEARRRCTNQI